MTVSWITPAGELQSPILERVPVSIQLIALSDIGNLTFSLIAGSLPRGLRLSSNSIEGSPTEVRKFTSYRFVIRAADDLDIEDRTFNLSVDGSDDPIWVTKEGFLNVGQGENYFALDNARVDFQLESYDYDEVAGDTLEYYITPNGGELPPGLTLSKSGNISGFTDPIFAVDNPTLGGYDTMAYDVTYFDKPEAKSNGYDTYLYDIETFDFSESSQVPRRLSRFYTFVVSVSDGRNTIKRLFRIWVVTDEFLKSDNTILQVDTNLFRADNTTNRVPIWITESNLGTHRANNYLTVYLDVYDPPTLSGTIVYLLLPLNPDSTPSQLPPGMVLDTITGEIAGKVPYQSRVSKLYTFTMQAIDYPVSLSNITFTLQGTWSNSIRYYLNQAVRYNGFIYVCTQEHINQLPSIVDSIFWKSGVATLEKTFFIEIIGEIDSAIEWVSNRDLGIIKANQASSKAVTAIGLLVNSRISYRLIDGSGDLPPGLTLIGTGEITGKVQQIADNNGIGGTIRNGLTRFFEVTDTAALNFELVYDRGSTTFDKVYTFSIQARDFANVAEITKEFTITVVSDNTSTFSNLYFTARQSKEKRLNWNSFITNDTVFKTSEIYRPGDLNFGIQSEIKVLVYAGIESSAAVKFVQAMSRNHYNKQLKFGDVKFAEARDPVTQTVVYEVVYVEVIDDFAKGNISISSEIQLPDNSNSAVLISYDLISIDSDIPLVSDIDKQRIFPNSIKNMRNRIKDTGNLDRTFLPLWMRSIQTRAFVETGYISALVLCYTKPAYALPLISRIVGNTRFASKGNWTALTQYRSTDTVLFRGAYYAAITDNAGVLPDSTPDIWIKNFDFSSIDFTVDRYLIDSVDGELNDKYLAFPTRGGSLP